MLNDGSVVPRRARIEGSQTCVSLNSRRERNKEEKKTHQYDHAVDALLADLGFSHTLDVRKERRRRCEHPHLRGKGSTHQHDHAVGTNRTTTSQKCAAVPRRARIEGSQTFVSFNSRLESNK